MKDERHYTREHVELREEGDGTLTVRITKWGESRMGGIVFADWAPLRSELELEGGKNAVAVKVPLTGLACFTPPDYGKDVAGQVLLTYAPGWVINGDTMDSLSYLDYLEDRHA